MGRGRLTHDTSPPKRRIPRHTVLNAGVAPVTANSPTAGILMSLNLAPPRIHLERGVPFTFVRVRGYPEHGSPPAPPLASECWFRAVAARYACGNASDFFEKPIGFCTIQPSRVASLPLSWRTTTSQNDRGQKRPLLLM